MGKEGNSTKWTSGKVTNVADAQRIPEGNSSIFTTSELRDWLLASYTICYVPRAFHGEHGTCRLLSFPSHSLY